MPLSDSSDATQVTKDFISNGRNLLDVEKRVYSMTEYYRWKTLITCLRVVAGRTIENKLEYFDMVVEEKERWRLL